MRPDDEAARVAFAERYGPWALVAGASEGVGRLGSMTRSEAVRAMQQMAAGGVMTRKHPEAAAYEERS